MATPIVNFATAYNAVVSAGQTVVEGNVVKIIADSGVEIGNATFQVIQGGNGVASEVATMTTAVESGSATTTGLGLLTLDVGIAGAMVAPALGVIAGIGLYNLAPEFWTDVSNALVNAGKTIGGKVVAFFDGDNVYFDDETIETIKTVMWEYNVFELNGYEPSPEQHITTDYKYPIYTTNSRVYLHYNPSSGFNDGYSEVESGSATAFLYLNWATGDYSGFTIGVVWASNNPFTVRWYSGIGDRTYIVQSRQNQYGIYFDDSFSYMAQFNTDLLNKVAILNGYTIPETLDSYEIAIAFITELTSHGYNKAEITKIITGGINTGGNSDNLQPGAVLPTENDPFTTTYPTWTPYEYPQSVPSPQALPSVYPLKYPEIGDTPYPTQSPAQNPQPESVPELYPKIMPNMNLSPQVEPTPTPSPDPDPQPSPDPIPEPETPTPSPDPVDPNPTPTPSPIPTAITLPTTVSSNKLFTVYNPSDSQLDDLGGYLWDSNIIEIISKMWQNPLDGIISLIQVYATPTVGTSQHIILGYLDSEVSAPVVTDQFVTVDCGTISINELKQNATDYTPYTSIHLFLPFIGFVEIDVNDFMTGTMGVKYRIDVYTGTCLATVTVTRTPDTPNGVDIYQFSGNCSQQIPLTGGNATGVLSSLVSAVGAGLSVASGGSLGVIAGATMIGKSLTHEMLHVSHSGNLSANAGILGGRKPYVIITRKQSYDANGYDSIYGFPSNKTVKLGNYTNQYLRVKDGFLKTTSTQPEHDEIMSLLHKGVII